ncbi:TatD family hydrolase [Methanopyrus kandleri]|uniref:Predicted metal-dependent hydrolase of the TIM-barrel fold n=2 Tax=Methanopyrus kandleri TaxID=2320 RepID=Q8TXX6_METKA|nr:TatD family hydrolase [Methanopyrus kandleri]AAM01748.1 Predicted metal-dependent hydrolase of the TIM-barrel fold [Methanopyrus kandleri AV19]HII70306.1 TatD family hydrolase [Methanopyrus kandleri]
MRYVDAHVHLDVRSYEDLERMALSGVRTVVTCAHDPYPDMTAEVYSALFRRLLGVETWRGEKAGLTVKVAVGVHPGGVPDNMSDVLREVEELLSHEDVVAIGETGLNENPDDREIQVLEAQLKLAREHEVPIIVHTPSRNKVEITEKVLEILNSSGIDPSLVLVDHASAETVSLIGEEGYAVGLTLRPGELDVWEACDIVEEYADEMTLIASSDLGSLAADPLALPKLALELERRNVEKSIIRDVVARNAERFYGL